VIRISQVKMGIRHIVIPGARYRTIVVTRLTAVMIVATPASESPINHRSTPVLGDHRSSDSGGYAVQPTFAAPPCAPNPRKTRRPPARNIQYDSAFSRGNAMSGAPICSGTR
jgi:hypothetical protein